MAKGEKIGAFGLTEPNAGSDAGAMATLDGGRIGIASQALGIAQGANGAAVGS